MGTGALVEPGVSFPPNSPPRFPSPRHAWRRTYLCTFTLSTGSALAGLAVFSLLNYHRKPLTPLSTLNQNPRFPNGPKTQAGSGWSLLSRPFSALSGGGRSGSGGGASAARPTGSPRAGPPTTSRTPRAPAAFETGWTATMAEPLLDMCYEIFFKYEKITLPLLPEILALHQVCGGEGNGAGGGGGWLLRPPSAARDVVDARGMLNCWRSRRNYEASSIAVVHLCHADV